MAKWKVMVDQEKCIGCGACVTLLPEIFELKEGKSVEKSKLVENEELGRKVEETVKVCPVNAITVEKIEE